MRPWIAIVLICAVTACSQFPELDASVSEETRDAPYPELVPLEGLQARISDTSITPEMRGGIEGRVARLRARAARLKRTVIDTDTRARMRAGVRQ